MKIAQVFIAPGDESEATKSHSYRILVVDDNEPYAKVMMWTLEMLGHTVKIAHGGPSAIALAKTFYPDIILLDIGLPGMNGYEICQAMRRESVLQNAVFIAQTGWRDEEHRKRSKEAGFDYYLVKPVDMEAPKNIFSQMSKEIQHPEV